MLRQQEHVGLWIAVAQRSVKVAVQRKARPLGLSSPQFWFLLAARELPKATRARRGARMIAAVLALLAASRVLTLDDALQTARQRQPQLRQARASTLAAEARAGQAFSGLLPQLTATGTFLKTTAN